MTTSRAFCTAGELLLLSSHTSESELEPISIPNLRDLAEVVTKDILNHLITEAANLVKTTGQDDVQFLADFLDLVLDEETLTATDRRNRILTVLSRVAVYTRIYPQRYLLQRIEYDRESVDAGGSGEVYQALGGTICVKVMRRTTDEALKSYVKELILWSHLSHSNVLPFFGLFLSLSGQRMCLVSPWMKNGNLSVYTAKLSQKDRMPLLLDVVNGLGHLHQLGIVHNDIKGQIVLISDEGRALVTDFGASHIATNTMNQGTTQSAIALSANFAAPELLQKWFEASRVRPSKACDIWCIGCLCYEILTRRVPFHGVMPHRIYRILCEEQGHPTRPEVVQRDDKDDCEDFDHYNEIDVSENVDDKMWGLMTSCWVYDPSARPTCQDIQGRFGVFCISDDRPVPKRVEKPQAIKVKSNAAVDFVRIEQLLHKFQERVCVNTDTRQSGQSGKPDSLSPHTDPGFARRTSISPRMAAVSSSSASNHNLSAGGTPTYIDTSSYALESSSITDIHVDLPAQRPLDPQDEEEFFGNGDNESRSIRSSLLSHIAVLLRDKIPRNIHVKGGIPYPGTFTGKDIVSTIRNFIRQDFVIGFKIPIDDRYIALQVARSLQDQLFFFEVEWGGRALHDGVEDVFAFLDDSEICSDAVPEREELPKGVVTILTRCYSPRCADVGPEEPACYSYSCPKRKANLSWFSTFPTVTKASLEEKKHPWTNGIDKRILGSLPRNEIERQSIIHQLIRIEEEYIRDLDIIEAVFIKPLRTTKPPVISDGALEDFIYDVFGNILDIRTCNCRLLEALYVRQREQGPIIQSIGDIFLVSAVEFRLAYPTYAGHQMAAEKRLKDEMEKNGNFRFFLEELIARTGRKGELIRPDLKHLLSRPSDHLQKYPALLDAVLENTGGPPDTETLKEAIESFKSLQISVHLKIFQGAMGKGAPGKWDWHDLVPSDFIQTLPKKEVKRQALIFELIKGEMAYVKDLENIKIIYVDPLRAAMPPIVPRDRLDQFIEGVFHNYWDLYTHHRRLLDKLHKIQYEEHPCIRSIAEALLDAVLNFRNAYMEYIPNYPIAAYRIDDEMIKNPTFKTFVDQCTRHPDAHRVAMGLFINRPIPRLLRYELILVGIMDNSAEGHEDRTNISNVIDAIRSLGKETKPGVQDVQSTVEVWGYNANLVFKRGETYDMDLLDESRRLVHSGKVLCQPAGGLRWRGWNELFMLLLDNYLVVTKPKEKDGAMKYNVYERPIPLDLLTEVNFTDPPIQRGLGLLRGLRDLGGGKIEEANSITSPDTATDSRFVYPMTLHHGGRTESPLLVYAETSELRTEWLQKFELALAARKAAQESNKVFGMRALNVDTFSIPSTALAASGPAMNQDTAFTGKVTCSVPFNLPDGRRLVAVGCAEGLWIGFRHDPRSLRHTLHLKQVTQCAMLDDFQVFLILAGGSLFAYHIEALVPSSPHLAAHLCVSQRLNGNKDVQFFSVGTHHGRTLIVYKHMRKERSKSGSNSIFRVLEPVGDKIDDRAMAPVDLNSRLGFRSRSEWFRVYRDFRLPSEYYNLIFLKARIAILCARSFEIMDLDDFNSVTIPQRSEDPRLSHLAKRLGQCRPLDMHRSSDDEFLLCYEEFGIYVDKHGDPSRSAGMIEWEDAAEHVALHYPYIVLFNSWFIEVRHIDTGRLAQIIPGNDICCIWDGRGVSSNLSTPGAISQDLRQEARIHVVMNNAEGARSGPSTKAIAQSIFELIPAIPPDPPDLPHKS